MDVIEIDGASNNGVDNIRELKENVTLAPFTSKYKIYIIDEVHMLSQGAFNALLKTLEEPPEHVIFILATTEPQKVPVTIRSRCQHIPFHSISPEDIYKRLNEVCNLENINAEPQALWEISRQAEGALRDALSLLEQVIASGDITLANVEAVLGTGSRPSFEKWIKTLRTDPAQAYENLKSMFNSGASSVKIFEEMFSLVKDLWLVSKWQKIAENLGTSEQEKNFLTEEAKNWKPEKLHYLLNVVNKILAQSRTGMKSEILLGMFFMMLEPAPAVEEFRPIINSSSLTPNSSSNNAPSAPVAVEIKEIELNEELKEKLLNTAHGENFIIYCALFDTKPVEENKKLILYMENLYCYEVLKIDRNAAALTKIFDEYSDIVLKFGAVEHTCMKYNNKEPEKIQKYEKPKEKEIPQEEPEEKEKIQIQRHEPSIFDKFRTELSQLQTRPEIILIKHNESEDEENINDLDLEQERDED